MAGYSGKPLVRKLGIKAGQRIALFGAPSGFMDHLGPLPEGARIIGRPRAEMNVILNFTDRRADLKHAFARNKTLLHADGSLWLCWPKQASGRVTDVSENIVRAAGLAAGLVDVKVCAVDETWSGLRFVYRLKDRATRRR
jgi:hypothetical protein